VMYFDRERERSVHCCWNCYSCTLQIFPVLSQHAFVHGAAETAVPLANHTRTESQTCQEGVSEPTAPATELWCRNRTAAPGDTHCEPWHCFTQDVVAAVVVSWGMTPYSQGAGPNLDQWTSSPDRVLVGFRSLSR
jgi:hypothetical protein